MYSKCNRILLIAALGLVAFACKSPLVPNTPGYVSFDFSSGSRGPGLPASVATIEITVKAADMETISLTLSQPKLSASLEVPAGRARTFDIAAKNAAGKVKFRGSQTAEIKAGAIHDLSVSMAALWTVTYYSEGSDVSGTVPVDAADYGTGAALVIAGNSGSLIRPGYVFAGWNTAADGTGTAYKAAESIVMPALDLSLYAQWKQVITYKVTFNANGGSAIAELIVEENSLITAPTPASTRTAYTFDAWYKEAALANAWNFTADTVGADTTLYAKWIPVSYTITYHLNGGTNAAAPDNPATYTVESPVITFASPTWGVNAFLGWCSDAALTTFVTGIPSGSTGNLDVYAKWDITTYALTFDANLPGISGTMPNQLIPNNTTVNLAPNAYSHPGYQFDGWGITAAGPVVYADGDPFAMGTSGMTLYAQWTLLTFTITYHLNGGTNAAPPANPTSYTFASAAIIFAPPTWGVNSFLGWCNDAALTTFISSIPGGSSGNLDVYAKWNITSFNISFNPNLAGVSGTMSMQSVPNNTTVNLAPNAYSHPGYLFAGWGIAAGGPVVYADGAPFAMGSSGMMLYAQWTPVNFFINYNLNGGDSYGANPLSYMTTSSTIILASGVWAGHIFLGWYADAAFTPPVVTSIAAGSLGNKDLYALWKLPTISFDANGGTGPLLTQQILGNTSANLVSNTYSKPGYTFAGWNTLPSGLGTPYANGALYSMGNGDITLYAQWTVDKEISSFSIVSPVSVAGIITGNNIAVTVPFGTDVTAMTPSTIFKGSMLTPGPNVVQNYTAPVNYTVTAIDTTTRVYTVTVTIALNPAKDITSFGFPSVPVAGSIIGTSISVTVPYGTNVTNLVPSIISSPGASVSPMPSMPQDFTSPFIYTVTAADTSTKVYTVTVTITPPSTNADLSSLVLSPIPDIVGFSSGNLNYNAVANYSDPSVTVTPTVADATATIQARINLETYQPATSGAVSLPMNLVSGVNTVNVLVTAQSGATKQYNIEIIKGVTVAISTPGNGNTNLSGPTQANPGDVLNLIATPVPGYRFVSWTGTATPYLVSGASAATTDYNVPAISGLTLVANFGIDFNGGSGTNLDPYEVSNITQLKNMNYFRDKFFVLTAPINLSSESNWLPIGDATTKFTGGFDGGNLILSGLTINSSTMDRGFFGFVEGAVIKNVQLTGINISTTIDYAGGLVGRSLGATSITDCSVTGTINGFQGIGGLLGCNDDTGVITILRCWTNVSINTVNYGVNGGLVGTTKGGSISQSYALGNVVFSSGTPNAMGGLVGMARDMNITDCYARGNVAGNTNVGGLVGAMDFSSAVLHCYATGSITYAASGGGLVGLLSVPASVTESLYDMDTSGMSDAGKGIPYPTTQMQTGTTFTSANWDFATLPVWKISALEYPKLNWQP